MSPTSTSALLALGLLASNAGQAIASNSFRHDLHQKVHHDHARGLFPPPFGPPPTPQDENIYDHVVIGGGTAGLTIASRLAQSGAQVAVIEAGGLYQTQSLNEFPATDVLPVGSAPAPNPIDWGFQVTAAGANDRSIHYARGKCLGGS